MATRTYVGKHRDNIRDEQITAKEAIFRLRALRAQGTITLFQAFRMFAAR